MQATYRHSSRRQLGKTLGSASAAFTALSLCAVHPQAVHAQTTLVNFDDLTGLASMPADYNGIQWEAASEWAHWDTPFSPYTAHSGKTVVYDQSAVSYFTFDSPQVFVGAWFTGYAGVTTFALYSANGTLLATSGSLSPSATPQFLSSGYGGPVSRVGVFNSNRTSWVMDDVIYQAAPEPSQFVTLGIGLLGLGTLALRTRRRKADAALIEGRKGNGAMQNTKNGLSLRVLLIFAAFGLAVTLSQAADAQNTANLLTNPGAETGNLTGWTAGGYSSAIVDNGTFDPGINPHTGSYDFCGGTGSVGYGTLDQIVALTGPQGISAAQIDSGTAQATVGFWEQGLNAGTSSDNIQVGVNFKDASGANVGLGTVFFADSHNGAWKFFTGSRSIPVGARSIDYIMAFVNNGGSKVDAFVDDNSLTLTAAPEPSQFAALGIGILGLAGLGLRARRRPADAT